MYVRGFAILLVLSGAVAPPPAPAGESQASQYTIVQRDGAWQLLRAGEPFYVKGAVGWESYDLLGIFNNALQQWRTQHDGTFPPDVAQVKADVGDDVLARMVETIEYQPPGTAGPDTEADPIAYDKCLLETIKGTHVLFSDGRIAFLPQRKLDTTHFQ